MPFPTLSRTGQARAIQQAASNTESQEAKVVHTYVDALGNVTAADIMVKGQVAPLIQVPNASGLKLYVGASVETRFVNGNKHYKQITGPSGSSTTAAAGAQAAADSVLSGVPAVPSDLSTAPVLLQAASLGAPAGFVEMPGANVAYTDTPASTGSGGPASGQRVVDVKALVLTSLPALPTALRDGTLVCLVDAAGDSQGLWRLDGAAGVWKRVDSALQSPVPRGPTWGLQGVDSSDGGGSAFNPGDISPAWQDYFDAPTGDLAFNTGNAALTPIAYEQHVVFYTRLKVAAAKTIQITVKADNAARVILNEMQVGADDNGDTSTTYSLALNAGWNTLALPYQNGQGDSYDLQVSGVGGTLASLVDRMAGYLPLPVIPVIPKREWALRLPIGTTAASTPDLTTVVDVPYGPGGATINWTLESVTLFVETPNAAATTIMPVWSAGGNAAFGGGTALLSAALSVTGASTYSAAAPAANISPTPLPSGSRVSLIVSAAGGSNGRVSLQWRES